MFARNESAAPRDCAAVAAKIELNDGRSIKGRFLIPHHKKLIDVLNGPAQFVDFEPFDGDLEVISKSAISSLRVLAMPGERHPAGLFKVADTFNPYEILGLERGASRSDVRAAYHRQSKVYHPDRYSHADLPPEVFDYLSAMARRINAAYEALSDDAQRVESITARRAETVYASAPPA